MPDKKKRTSEEVTTTFEDGAKPVSHSGGEISNLHFGSNQTEALVLDAGKADTSANTSPSESANQSPAPTNVAPEQGTVVEPGGNVGPDSTPGGGADSENVARDIASARVEQQELAQNQTAPQPQETSASAQAEISPAPEIRTASGAASQSSSASEPVNEAPTDITVAGGSVDENAAAGTVVATLGGVDEDSGENLSYSINDPSGNFEVVGNEIRVKAGASIDFEDAQTHDVTVTVTDSEGLTYEETVRLDVGDINEGPSSISLDNSSVNENNSGGVVGTLTTADEDAGDTVTYSVDDARFEVVDGQLTLKDGISLDHEAEPTVNVTVTATDSGGLQTSQSFNLNAIDVNEAPTDITVAGGSVDENSAAGTVVATLGGVDGDEGDSLSYSINDASGNFEIVGNEIRVKAGASIDFEDAQTHDVTVTVTDSDGLAYEETITLNINDIDEFNEITGTSGNDTLRGTGGQDSISGLAGNDIIIGGAGADRIDAGAGNDTIYIDADDISIQGGDGTDRVIVQGSDGVDLDMAASSIERADGGTGNDNFDASDSTVAVTQLGNGGDDTLTGGSGNDRLYGGDGNDTISGGDGNDVLIGGDGSDFFVFEEGGGTDTINGGSGGGWTDTIELQGADGGEMGGWTVQLDSGTIDASDTGSMDLSDDASGSIIFEDGSQINFNDIERIEW